MLLIITPHRTTIQQQVVVAVFEQHVHVHVEQLLLRMMMLSLPLW